MIEFPIINNIADILPHIEGRDEFIVADKEGYRVINYNVMFADTFLHAEEEGISADERLTRQMRRECRGIIFDSETGNIIRRPFHKFKNVNEAPETQQDMIDLSRPHAILEKLDGSMIAVFKHPQSSELIWGTKMVAQDFHKMVSDFVADSIVQYEPFCRDVIDAGFTPIFEFLHPQKQIVVKVVQPRLILTAIRNMITGEYIKVA